jgi:hypothetical protein
MDGNALPHALCHCAEFFKLGEHALGMVDFSGTDSELQMGIASSKQIANR